MLNLLCIPTDLAFHIPVVFTRDPNLGITRLKLFLCVRKLLSDPWQGTVFPLPGIAEEMKGTSVRAGGSWEAARMCRAGQA